MATPEDIGRAAELAALAYDRARSLSMAPLNRWAREWQTFKARAKALRSAPDTAETRAAIAAAALDAAEHFTAEADRHNALTFREKLAALDKDFSEKAA